MNESAATVTRDESDIRLQAISDFSSESVADQNEAKKLKCALLKETLNKAIDQGNAENVQYYLEMIRREFPIEQSDVYKVVSAAWYLDNIPPNHDWIVESILEINDKFILIGSSKSKKSWLMQQLAFCIATGRDFLRYRIPKARNVLLFQHEMKESGMWRRVHYMGQGLGVAKEELDERFMVINGRGFVEAPGEVIPTIQRTIEKMEKKPDVLMIDPIYKLVDDENNAKEWKPVLNLFDRMMNTFSCSIVYSHHDPKGDMTMRNTVDRGSGSNVTIRDTDNGMFIMRHKTVKEAINIDFLVRQYIEQPSMVALFDNDLRMFKATDIEPDNGAKKPKAESLGSPIMIEKAVEILDEPIPTTTYRTLLQERLSISEKKQRGLFDLLLSMGRIEKMKKKQHGGAELIRRIKQPSGTSEAEQVEKPVQGEA